MPGGAKRVLVYECVAVTETCDFSETTRYNHKSTESLSNLREYVNAVVLRTVKVIRRAFAGIHTVAAYFAAQAASVQASAWRCLSSVSRPRV